MVDVGGLEIGITAQTADAQAGIRGVRDQLDDLDGDALEAAGAMEQTRRSTDDLARSSVSLTGALSTVSASASRAGDEVEEAGDSATQAAGGFATATTSVGIFNLTLGQTIVTLGVLGAALTAVGTAALGFIGILGAVGGAFGLLGLVAVIENLSALRSAFAETLPGIREAFAPLGDVFGPLLLEGIRSLDELAEDVVASIRASTDNLGSFADTLRRIGGLAGDIIPALVGGMFSIAEDALPTINSILDEVGTRGAGLFDVVGETFRELRPELTALAGAFADFLPDFIKFGTTVAEVIIPPLTALLEVLDSALERFNKLPESVQKAIVIGGGTALVANRFRGGGGGGLPGLGNDGGGGGDILGGILGGALRYGKKGLKLGAKGTVFAGKKILQGGRGLVSGLRGLGATAATGATTALAPLAAIPGNLAALVRENLPGGITGRRGVAAGTNIQVDTIVASGRQEGRQARQELLKVEKEMRSRNVDNTSYGPGVDN